MGKKPFRRAASMSSFNKVLMPLTAVMYPPRIFRFQDVMDEAKERGRIACRKLR